ncbi:MAG: diguanylate cyclase [Desulfuromonadaceae bacterium GWC2_58_13]|nr:MAG: diguanylate cyclase [Desulfuromonadaceae bacterium GWC2_58_13]
MSQNGKEECLLVPPLVREFKLPAVLCRKEERFADPMGRLILAARARWLFLALVAIYGICAGALYSFSKYGFFLSRWQIILMMLSVATIVFYNLVFPLFFAHTKFYRLVSLFQIWLDLTFVTVLIYFSGSGSSWFWPVYLLVTLEAAVLVEKKQCVWGLGALGACLYGALLTATYLDVFPHVSMPFVDNSLHHDGLYLFLMWCWVSLLNASAAVIGAYLMAVVRRENLAVRESEEQLISFLDSANDLIFSVNGDGIFLYVNRAWRETLGYDPDSDAHLRIEDIIFDDDRARCTVEIRRVVESRSSRNIEGRLIARNGRLIDVEGNLTFSSKDGAISTIWAICRDVTSRKKAQEQLYHMAHHDMLTSLPNRLFFIDRLQQANAIARRLKKQVAVLFLDLDRFKIINDTLGHSIGDMLLQEIADRLKTCVREVDTVARLGGDEFTVILGSINGVEDAEHIADKVLKKLAQPFSVEEHELFVTTSIGICMFPTDSDDPASLIKKADIAMYSAKAQGRNNYMFYNPGMDLNADRRLILTNGLRRALDREEFRIHYQPKIDILSGKITAMEALLRWEHPELGLVPPGDFIPIAEETGIIIALGEWVMRRACEQVRLWQSEGLPAVRVAVNLSGYQLQHRDFVQSVKRILDQVGLPGSLLEFEVTETVIMQNPDFAVSILNQLREDGIHISIDDFGTGYSSLAHLKRFSVNTLKIDKSFVRDVESNSTDAAIASAIITMGNSLNLKVIAEGVETEGQLAFLKDHRCDEIQGFLFSRPLPPGEAAEFLRNGVCVDHLKVEE